MDELDTSGAFFWGVARAVGRAAAAVVDKINFTCLKKEKNKRQGLLNHIHFRFKNRLNISVYYKHIVWILVQFNLTVCFLCPGETAAVAVDTSAGSYNSIRNNNLFTVVPESLACVVVLHTVIMSDWNGGAGACCG